MHPDCVQRLGRDVLPPLTGVVVARRCVCGRSKAYPLCDGAHASLGWTCTPHDAGRPAWCFVAGPASHNLAERLAHELGGVALHRAPEVTRAERLVVLLEGHEVDAIEASVARVEAPARQVWALGPEAVAAAGALGGATVILIAEEGRSLWNALLAAARGEAAATRAPGLLPTFLSHAVADEPALAGPLERLRRVHRADVFLCADSIAPGTAWEETILRELIARPRFVLAWSEATRASTSCAFEAGAARALGRHVRLVGLDGTPPPAFLQHLQVIDVPRQLRARPWLGFDEALLSALLAAIRDDDAC
jgi:hypothetical protein